MSSAASEHSPISATEEEQPALARIEDLLEDASQHTALMIGPDEETIEIPATLYQVLRQVVHYLANDEAVSIVPIDRELTSQQAADLLNVSRPYLIQILDEGQLSYRRVGTHRRIAFGDLMAYKQQRDQERRDALRQLTQMSQQLGLYEHPSKKP